VVLAALDHLQVVDPGELGVFRDVIETRDAVSNRLCCAFRCGGSHGVLLCGAAGCDVVVGMDWGFRIVVEGGPVCVGCGSWVGLVLV